MHVYIYIYICVCVCVCVYLTIRGHRNHEMMLATETTKNSVAYDKNWGIECSTKSRPCSIDLHIHN